MATMLAREIPVARLSLTSKSGIHTCNYGPAVTGRQPFYESYSKENIHWSELFPMVPVMFTVVANGVRTQKLQDFSPSFK